MGMLRQRIGFPGLNGMLFQELYYQEEYARKFVRFVINPGSFYQELYALTILKENASAEEENIDKKAPEQYNM